MSQLPASSTSIFLPCKFNPTRNPTYKQKTIRFCSIKYPNNTTHRETTTHQEQEEQVEAAPPVVKKKKRYRREYPGESKGITQEMRFLAMRLRNINGKHNDANTNHNSTHSDSDTHSDPVHRESSGEEESWVPSIEGFLKYLVDSHLVFNAVERIVDNSDHVSYVYFRNSGLERSDSLSKDLEWFAQQNFVIPQPSNPGLQYVKYLEQLAEESAPLFLCHFYNIYFAHIAGGQVIVKQVSDKLLIEKELDYCRWEGDVPEMLKSLREKINNLSEDRA